MSFWSKRRCYPYDNGDPVINSGFPLLREWHIPSLKEMILSNIYMFWKKFFSNIAIFLAIFSVGVLPAFTVAVAAPPDPKATNYGINTVQKAAGLPTNVAGQTSIPGLIGVIVGLALSLVAVVFFVLILYSGAVWMTAMGNSERVTKAKTTLETAAIGLVIVLAAYAIATFVFSTLAGGASAEGG